MKRLNRVVCIAVGVRTLYRLRKAANHSVPVATEALIIADVPTVVMGLEAGRPTQHHTVGALVEG